MDYIIKPAEEKKIQSYNSIKNKAIDNKKITSAVNVQNKEVEEVDFSMFNNSKGFDVSLQDLLEVKKLNEQINNKVTDIEVL